VGTKIATAGALDAADLQEAADAISDETSELTDKYLGELLTQQKQNKGIVQEFRDALAALPALLGEPEQNPSELQQKPLIFIIDELDRCRPLFALEILERIKHFFSVPNIHFVLGAHLDQLCNSVILAYGPKIDARVYLQKFIHLTFQLVERAEFQNERTITKFVNYLRRVMEFKSEDSGTVNSSLSIVCRIAHQRDLSLRTIEQIVTLLAIALAYSAQNFFRPAAILAGLCVMKVIAPEHYRKAKAGTLRLDEVRTVLMLGSGMDDVEQNAAAREMEVWVYCTDESADPDLVTKFDNALAQYGFRRRENIVPFVANNIIDRLIAS